MLGTPRADFVPNEDGYRMPARILQFPPFRRSSLAGAFAGGRRRPADYQITLLERAESERLINEAVERWRLEEHRKEPDPLFPMPPTASVFPTAQDWRQLRDIFAAEPGRLSSDFQATANGQLTRPDRE